MPKYILNPNGTIHDSFTKTNTDPCLKSETEIQNKSNEEINKIQETPTNGVLINIAIGRIKEKTEEIKKIVNKEYTHDNLKEIDNVVDNKEKNNIKRNDFINTFSPDVDLIDKIKSNDYINTNLLNKIQSNHSYENGEFLAEPKYENYSYKAMYSYNSENSNSNLYAQEFEIKSGYRFHKEEGSNDPTVYFEFLLKHIADITIQFALIEAIKIINGVIGDHASGVIENFHLKLGNYTYTEFDVFTRYINKVLNYPNDRSTLIERIIAYLLGFNEYIAINKTIDYDNLIKKISNNDNKNKYTIINFDGNFEEILNPIAALLASLLQITVETLLDDSNNKRIILLQKKFAQENHWINNILYKPKNDSEHDSSKFFDKFHYYFFKFTIERMNIGLKIVNRYIKNNHDIFNNNSINTNRLFNSKNSLNEKDNFIIESESKISGELIYKWSNKGSYNSIEKNQKNKVKESSIKLRGLPSALLLHDDLLKSIFINRSTNDADDNILDIQNDIKQNFVRAQKQTNRIESGLIKEIENSLEAEYMPFYFHDLRTNELLAFHAFIDNISDAFSPEYTSSSGFGRVDDVKAYVKTTRTINLSFTLVATSENDHDYMWYQINKLVAMVYPQWSEGIKNTSADSQFTFPFTQVPTASPLIRLRVGDVIKSNYSTINLSRLFGTQNNKKTEGFEFVTSDSDIKYELLPGIYSRNTTIGYPYKNIKIDHPVNIKYNGDIFGISSEKYIDIEIDDEHHIHHQKSLVVDASKIIIKNAIKIESGLDSKKTILGAAQQAVGNAKLDVTEKNAKLDAAKAAENAAAEQEAKAAAVEAAKALEAAISNRDNVAKERNNIIDSIFENNSIIKSFDVGNKINNPITGAYESGMGRGLAGFITNIDMNYNESTWETSRIGSKAPIFVKITMGFSPIHDIAPGLDHNGMIRAPVYNVGRLNNQFFGDPHDEISQSGDINRQGSDMALLKYKMILKN